MKVNTLASNVDIIFTRTVYMYSLYKLVDEGQWRCLAVPGFRPPALINGTMGFVQIASFIGGRW